MVVAIATKHIDATSHSAIGTCKLFSLCAFPSWCFFFCFFFLHLFIRLSAHTNAARSFLLLGVTCSGVSQ